MTTHLEVAQALVSAGYLSEADIKATAAVLADHLIVLDAEDTKAFATQDLAYQEQVIAHAEEMAEEDLSMGDIGDRFIQAEVIDSAASLAEKDAELIKKADTEIAIAFKDASGALFTARLIDEANLEAVASIMAGVWETTESD